MPAASSGGGDADASAAPHDAALAAHLSTIHDAHLNLESLESLPKEGLGDDLAHRLLRALSSLSRRARCGVGVATLRRTPSCSRCGPGPLAGGEIDEVAYNWYARRLRKHLALPSVAEEEAPPPPPPFRWLAWLDLRAYAFGPPDKAVPWWVALLFGIGAALFVTSGVAGLVPSVTGSAEGLRSPYSLLVGIPNMLGAIFFFTPAGYLMIFEALNMGFAAQVCVWGGGGAGEDDVSKLDPNPPTSTCLPPMQVARWDRGEAKGPRPRRRFWGWAPERLSWWAGIIQFVGMLFFNVGCATTFALSAVALSDAQVEWLISFTFLVGGIFFFISGYAYSVEATNSLYRGLLPTRLSDLASLRCAEAVAACAPGAPDSLEPCCPCSPHRSWQVGWWNWIGGIGFFLGGIAGYIVAGQMVL